MRITSSDLREKDVINVTTATVIGRINEVEFDSATGQITTLLILKDKGIFSLFKESPIRITWDKIVCIGEDAVLVRLSNNEIETVFSSRKED